MKVRRTPLWQYLIFILVGLIAGMGFVVLSDHTSIVIIGTTWFVPFILLVLAGIVLYATWQVRQYITTPPKERKKRIEPIQAVRILVMAKSLGIVSSLLLGSYLGQILLLLTRRDIPFYHAVILRCMITALVCIIDLISSILGEWFCQIPPDDKKPGNIEPRTSPRIRAVQMTNQDRHYAEDAKPQR